MTTQHTSALFCVVSNAMLVDGKETFWIQPYEQEIDWSHRHEFSGTMLQCEEWIKAHSSSNYIETYKGFHLLTVPTFGGYAVCQAELVCYQDTLEELKAAIDSHLAAPVTGFIDLANRAV